MTNAEILLITLFAVVLGAALAFVVWVLVDVVCSTGRHQREMAQLEARKEAILAEHAAWVARTGAILDECVVGGSLSPETAARYRRFVR